MIQAPMASFLLVGISSSVIARFIFDIVDNNMLSHVLHWGVLLEEESQHFSSVLLSSVCTGSLSISNYNPIQLSHPSCCLSVIHFQRADIYSQHGCYGLSRTLKVTTMFYYQYIAFKASRFWTNTYFKNMIVPIQSRHPCPLVVMFGSANLEVFCHLATGSLITSHVKSSPLRYKLDTHYESFGNLHKPK